MRLFDVFVGRRCWTWGTLAAVRRSKNESIGVCFSDVSVVGCYPAGHLYATTDHLWRYVPEAVLRSELGGSPVEILGGKIGAKASWGGEAYQYTRSNGSIDYAIGWVKGMCPVSKFKATIFRDAAADSNSVEKALSMLYNGDIFGDIEMSPTEYSHEIHNLIQSCLRIQKQVKHPRSKDPRFQGIKPGVKRGFEPKGFGRPI